jgi:hypothetical protein
MPDDVPVLSSQLQGMQNEMKAFFLKELSTLTNEVRKINLTVEGVDR